MLAFAPLDGAVSAATTALGALTELLEPAAGTAAAAVAIVLFTIVVRLLISPLTVVQVRAERRRAALAPQIRELQQRYAGQPDRLGAELMARYRQAGASPVAGCLPALLQAPFFLVMYRLFSTGEGSSGQFAGVMLDHHVTDGLAGTAGPLFGVLLLVLLGLAWWSSRRMRRSTLLAAPVTEAGAARPAGSAAASGASAGELPGAGALARLLPLLPYGTLLVALVVPLAGVLYLVTTTAWTALEQAVLRRPETSTNVDKDVSGTYKS